VDIMRHAFAIVLVVLATLTIGVRPTASAEQTGPVLVVAIVDVQKILNESKAAKGVRATVEKQEAAYQKDIAQRENALRTADQDLARQRGTLSAEAFNKKRQDLQKQAETLGREVQTKRKSLDQMFQNGMGTVRDTLLKIITDIATERGATLVLSKSQVLLAANEYDVTAEALKRLDAKLPSVAVQVPK
jgi:Skp family chaperone for outer membrane proteins